MVKYTIQPFWLDCYRGEIMKRWVFYLTGFLSGLSVMAIELGASRLMAPYFSSSQIVWTIIIGTIMIAMAIGNVIGGKMADKNQSPDKLFIWLFAAATWTMLIPLLGKFIISGVAVGLAMIVKSNYLIWAAFISCILVFVFPLLVLGMVTPNLVKFSVQSLDENGKTVGIIEACNTIGSIIGTFIPTFVSIPWMGTALTFVVFATVMYIACLVYFMIRKTHVIKTSVIAVLCLAAGIASSSIGVVYWDSTVKYEGESIYNYLRVEETDRSIILSTNVLFGVQSIKMKDGNLTGMYYDYALAAPTIAGAAKEEKDILILGMGTGTFATQCVNYFGSKNIDGVEIDQKIVDLAHEYFDLPQEVNTYTMDGRAFIQSAEKKYDIILVDAYQDITIPFHLSSLEFFKYVESHLNEGGVMVINMNMYTDNEGGINDYLSGTVAEVFESVYTCPTASNTNMELFAANGYDVKERLTENTDALERGELKNLMNRVNAKLTKVEKNGYVLTDDKAAVELLGMAVLDDMILNEIDYVKKAIEGKSLKELIDMIFSGELF